MSFEPFEYRCTGCSYVQPDVHHSVTLRYPLEDGRYGTGYRRAGWCKVCNKVVDVELLPNAADVQSELTEAERTIREGGSGHERAERLAERYRGTLAWLAQRQSRPRCLKCGTEQDATPKEESDGVLRHSCGGILEEVSPESGPEIRVSVVPIRYVMSVDGLILRKERDNRRDD